MKYEDSTYDRLIEELFAKHPTVQKAGFGNGAYKPGLEGMGKLDDSLGNPWKNYRCIHVAGTNGKGSVSSMLTAALAAEGLKVGLYTSPHLVDFRERMKIISKKDGNYTKTLIPKEDVFEFLTQNDLEGLSFFEITTGMAFSWFAACKVDAAVIEVGLGGRLDSTNIITPELSVVTSIGLDHCAMLGDTRAKIASEKAGIFKNGVPAVVAVRDEETAPVFEQTAAHTGAILSFADERPCPDGIIEKLDLKGPYQKLNVRTTLAALDRIGIKADLEAICRTAEITGFHGRWEKIQDSPEVICDIGHNPAALAINFKELSGLGRPLAIVYGIMADKDLDGIAPLMPAGAEYILAAPATERSLKVGELYARLRALRPDLTVSAADSVADAVRIALEKASADPRSLVYIGGSTFVVSEAVTYLKHNTE